MFFNSMRKPRGFNHQYIYVDEDVYKRQMENGSKDRYFQSGTADVKKLVPEGVACLLYTSPSLTR